MKRWFFLIIANLITASRLAVVTYLAYLAINDSLQFDIFFALLVYGFFSDILDGYVAKKCNAQSKFGAAFDPLADKLLICFSFVYLIFKYWPPSEIIVSVKMATEFFVITLIFLEIFIISSSAFAILKRMGSVSNVFGKIKMTLESIAVSIWVLSIIGEEYTKIVILPLTVLLIDVILIFAIYFALISIQTYWQDYQKFKKSLSP